MLTHFKALLCIFAALAYLTPGAVAHADTSTQTKDKIIYGQNDALWTTSIAGQSSRLLSLPWPAQSLKQLEVSSDGSALILAAKGFVAWTELTKSALPASPLHWIPCSGRAVLSQDGNQVACATMDTKRIAIYTLRPSLEVTIIDRKAKGPLFFAATPNTVIDLGDKENIVALNSEGERVVAHHRPDTLVVSPDGRRAVGDYSEGAIQIVYTFRLDGKATKRTLVHAARALAVSADSGWVAVQQEMDACAVRIVGGQYMCWRRFEALAISSQGQSLLLSQGTSSGHDLSLGAVNGTSSRKPTPLVQGVAPIAAFWPAPNGN